MSILRSFWYMVCDRSPAWFIGMWICPVVPEPFVVLSPLRHLGTLVKNKLTINVRVYLWTLNSILSIYVSILMAVPHRLDYSMFWNRKIWVLLLYSFCQSKDCFGFWGLLEFSSVQSFSRVRLSATPWIAARQAALSNTNSWSLFKLMSIALVMPSSHPILCCPLLLLPLIPPSIRVFSNESTLLIG